MSEKSSVEDIIPEQQSGIETNTETSVEFNSPEEARTFYQKAKHRLLHVNDWHGFAGTLTANFQLTDKEGKEVNRAAVKDDYFKIDIPGPGPVTGDGFDWVRVEAIEEKEEEDRQSIAIRVRPASNPNNERKDVAHFFSVEATSCFMVKREKNTVTAAIYGRNEKPNTDTETIVDKARNTAIATGAVTGFAKLQWKSLVNGLVRKED
jgi:hypothetical protein